jgi:hypothetical protein
LRLFARAWHRFARRFLQKPPAGGRFCRSSTRGALRKEYAAPEFALFDIKREMGGK